MSDFFFFFHKPFLVLETNLKACKTTLDLLLKKHLKALSTKHMNDYRWRQRKFVQYFSVESLWSRNSPLTVPALGPSRVPVAHGEEKLLRYERMAIPLLHSSLQHPHTLTFLSLYIITLTRTAGPIPNIQLAHVRARVSPFYWRS